MAHFSNRDITYNALNNEFSPPLANLRESTSHIIINPDQEHEDSTNVIIHRVPRNKDGWTHIEDLDSFFTRMYEYYIQGGFLAMSCADIWFLLKFFFVVVLSTVIAYFINYPKLFRNEPYTNRTEKININDVFYSFSDSIHRISWTWWCIIVLCLAFLVANVVLSVYHIYRAYDTKLFYNNVLKIDDEALCWTDWSTIQAKVRAAQPDHQMCVHKQEINELDIYHRVLRFNNYLVAMVNKNILPLHLYLPFFGEIKYLTKALEWNLKFLLFSSPWSPWENCWQLRDSYKDHTKRMALASQLRKQILLLAAANTILAPFIQIWQLIYLFFRYAELIKRSPSKLGQRRWSVYANVTLRHFNELEHELIERLNNAQEPATKYVASFVSPVLSVIAMNLYFMAASVLGVLIVLAVYDEDVLTVGYVLALMTMLGVILACLRGLINENAVVGGMRAGREGEALLVQVLGHAHYLPAAWRGRAHLPAVASQFQQLFQYQATYIVFELFSPMLCPIVLIRLSSRALDIVDFYRNFTVSILGIGDVCSFAQLDIKRHGNPEWQMSERDSAITSANSQYMQGEGGKTELSLVAFSCRHPRWQPADPTQRQFLRSLRYSVYHALPSSHSLNNTMLGSYIQKSLLGGNAPLSAAFSGHSQKQQSSKLPEMDEMSEEGEGSGGAAVGLGGVGAALGASALGYEPQPACAEDASPTRDMSVSTLHLYDLHLSQASQAAPACCVKNCSVAGREHADWAPNVAVEESTPLLSRPHKTSLSYTTSE